SAYGDMFWVLAFATAAYAWTPLLMKEESRYALGAAPADAGKPRVEKVRTAQPGTGTPATPVPAHRSKQRRPEPAVTRPEPVGSGTGRPSRTAATPSGGRHRRVPERVGARGRSDASGPGRSLPQVPPLGDWVLTRISFSAREAGRLSELATTTVRRALRP